MLELTVLPVQYYRTGTGMPTTRHASRLHFMADLRPGCVRFANLPQAWTRLLPRDVDLYSLDRQQYAHAIDSAQQELRAAANFSWALHSSDGEPLAMPDELLRKFSGIIFVGDSQVRELAWAALRWIAPNTTMRYAKPFSPRSYEVHRACQPRMTANATGKGQMSFGNCSNRLFPICRPGMLNNPTDREQDKPLTGLHTACAPRGVGRYGWTAVVSSDACVVHSPLETQPADDLCAQAEDVSQGGRWDGQLHLPADICAAADSSFFLTYVGQYSAFAIEPASIPSCFNASRGRRVAWVINGSPLHVLRDCVDPALIDALPQTVLARFPSHALESVVWQTAAAGFAGSIRPARSCSNRTPAAVAAVEQKWLQKAGVAYFDYMGLASAYAPLMVDGRHFSWTHSSYYHIPCNRTFPELALLAFRLAFQSLLGRAKRVCVPGLD